MKKMNNIGIVISLGSLALFAGCASHGTREAYDDRLVEYGKAVEANSALWSPYEDQMKPAAPAARPDGSKDVPNAPMPSVESFRTPDQYKAYGFNPRPSPYDPDGIRLGAGVAIRKESEGAWLYEDNRQELLIGDAVSTEEFPLRPLLLERDLAFELQRERQARLELGEMVDHYAKLSALTMEDRRAMAKLFLQLQAQINVKDEIIASQTDKLEELLLQGDALLKQTN